MKDIYDDIAEEICSSLSTGDEELNIELEILDHLKKHLYQDDSVHIRFNMTKKKIEEKKTLLCRYFEHLFREITGQYVEVTTIMDMSDEKKIKPVVRLKICTYQISIRNFMRLIMCLLSSKEIDNVGFFSVINRFRFNLSRKDFSVQRAKNGRYLLYHQNVIALALDLEKPLFNINQEKYKINDVSYQSAFINECIHTLLNTPFLKPSKDASDYLFYMINKCYLPEHLNPLCWIRKHSTQFKNRNFFIRTKHSRQIRIKLLQPSINQTQLEEVEDKELIQTVTDKLHEMKILNADMIAFQKNTWAFILYFGFYYEPDTHKGAFVTAEVIKKSYCAQPKILKELENLIVER